MSGKLLKVVTLSNKALFSSKTSGCCVRFQYGLRQFSASPYLLTSKLSSDTPVPVAKTDIISKSSCVNITFVVTGNVPVGKEWEYVNEDTPKFTVAAELHKKLLIVIQENIHLDRYGVCLGNLTCGTCRIVFKPADFEKLPLQLDKEFRVNETCGLPRPISRLGCQLYVTEAMDGMEMLIPRPLLSKGLPPRKVTFQSKRRG